MIEIEGYIDLSLTQLPVFIWKFNLRLKNIEKNFFKKCIFFLVTIWSGYFHFYSWLGKKIFFHAHSSNYYQRLWFFQTTAHFALFQLFLQCYMQLIFFNIFFFFYYLFFNYVFFPSDFQSLQTFGFLQTLICVQMLCLWSFFSAKLLIFQFSSLFGTSKCIIWHFFFYYLW